MYLVYDHLYIPLLPNKANSSHKPLFFLWKKPTVVLVKISEKKKIFFSGLRSCYHKQAHRKKLILPLKKYFETCQYITAST